MIPRSVIDSKRLTSVPRLIQRMYLWRRQASQKWWSNHQDKLRAAAGKGLAIIEQSGRKRLDLEVTCRSRSDGQKLTKEFSGRLEKLPRNWLKRFSRKQPTKPLRIGQRLIVVRSARDEKSTK